MTTRAVIANGLAIFNVVGLAIVFFGVMHLIIQLDADVVTARKQTQQEVAQVQASERETISILRCQFALFGRDRHVTVTLEQLDSCLKGTSLDTPTPPSSTAAPRASTPPSQFTVPKTAKTDNPNAQQPTTSEPPTPNGGSSIFQPVSDLLKLAGVH